MKMHFKEMIWEDLNWMCATMGARGYLNVSLRLLKFGECFEWLSDC